MRLYGFWRSTATWRIRIALEVKGIPYEYVPVNLARGVSEQRSPEFAKRNPMKHVPVLEVAIDGTTRSLAESIAILEYLEETAPTPALLPRDTFLRARTRQIAALVASGIQPLQNTKVQEHVELGLGLDPREWVRHWVVPGLVALETLVRETAGAFCVGDEITFADCCLVPQLAFAERFGVDAADLPTLVRIGAACGRLPAFQRAHADRQVDAPRTTG